MNDAVTIDVELLSKYQFRKSSERIYKMTWENFNYTLFISGNLISVEEECEDIKRWRINKLFILNSSELDYILNRLFATQLNLISGDSATYITV